jgi:hypothetical protein
MAVKAAARLLERNVDARRAKALVPRKIYQGAWTFYTSGDSEEPLFSIICFGFSRAIGCRVRGRKAENPFGD